MKSKRRGWPPVTGPDISSSFALTTAASAIPLTIADSDARRGTITLVIQVIGATTERLCALQDGDALTDVVGPLGKATEIENFGHVVLVGGGVGTAVIYPQAAALKGKGNRVTAVMGGRSMPYVILEQELRPVCDAVYPCTDDGSYGYNGFVTGKAGRADCGPALPVNAVITAGPVPMMRAIAKVTRHEGHSDHRVAQPHHGGRHGHVRRLPRHRGWKESLRVRRWPRIQRARSRFCRRSPTACPLIAITSAAFGRD